MQNASVFSKTTRTRFALNRLNEAGRSEFLASLALRHTKGLGLRSAKLLLEHFGSAHAALSRTRDWGAAKVGRAKAALLESGSWRAGAQEEWERARRLDADILLWSDSRYPDCLRELPDAPPLLYSRGDTTLLRSPCVAVVGSRRCSAEGLEATRRIASHLAACGVTIVSGLALGIDREAHLSALKQTGKTIAVLGTGIDVVYPKKNKELASKIASEALILTEFMPGVQPDAGNFPIRNRLISGLSLGVLVVEAADKSGSLITARLALEQNREVYAVPISVFGPLAGGCRELVRRGAHPVFSAEDILLDLAPRLKSYEMLLPVADSLFSPGGLPKTLESPPRSGPSHCAKPATPDAVNKAPPCLLPKKTSQPPLPPGECGRVLGILREMGVCHIDVLAQRLSLPAARVSALLVQMELQALVRRLPGMKYCEQ